MTYEYVKVEFTDGINLLIGPNGVGKSAIVCAIALALGGTPRTLGRGKELNEFVRTGSSSSKITLSLVLNGTERTVARVITQTNSLYFIDGKQMRSKEHVDYLRSMNIRMDNLCQFLPQDRVSQFVKMTPEELLEATLLVSGRESALVARREAIVATEELKNDRDSSLQLEKRTNELARMNKSVEEQVASIREREMHLERLNQLTKKRAWCVYNQKKSLYLKCKSEHNEVVSKKAEVDRRYAQEKATYDEICSVVSTARLPTQDLESLKDEIKSAKTNTVLIKRKLTSLQREKENVRALQKALRKEIDEIEKQHKETAVNEDASLRSKLSEAQKRLSEVSLGTKLKNDECLRLQVEGSELTTKLNELNARIEKLKNSKTARELLLERLSPDTYKAVQWIRRNGESFKGTVCEPPILCLDVSDQRYVDEIECCMPQSVLLTIICSNTDDMELLMKELVDGQRLRINVAECKEKCEKRPPVADPSSYGFDGYLVSYCTAPALVIGFLCQIQAFGCIPVTKKKVQDCTLFPRYLSANYSYEVRRSRYSQKDIAIYSFKIKQSRIFSTNNAAPRCEEAVAELDSVRKRQSSNTNTYKELLKALESEKTIETEARERVEKLRERLNEYEETKRRARELSVLLELKKSELKETNEEHYDREIEELSPHLESSVAFYVDLLCRNIKEDYTMYSSYSAYVKTLNLRKEIRQRLVSIETDRDSLQTVFLETKEAVSESKREMKEAQRTAEDLQPLNEEALALFAKLPNTVSEIDTEVNVAQRCAKLCTSDTQLLKDYESRALEIEDIGRELKKYEEVIRAKEEKSKSCCAAFEKEARAVLLRVNDGFEALMKRIGYEGRVELLQNEDCNKWSVTLRVSFRKGEALQTLTSMRQSGGEKSLSTVLYLLSLNNLSSGSFKILDEINQGMDSRNESFVHNLLVETAEESSVQYIIITPKLLSNLRYSERVNVIVLFGENVVV